MVWALVVSNALLVLILLFVLYSFHKIKAVHLSTYEILQQLEDVKDKHLNNLLNQAQALFWLYKTIHFNEPLPAVRGWAASPDFLLALAEHARNRPDLKAVVECGSGVSTVVLARCMQLNGGGHVYSLDHDERFAASTRELLKRYDLDQWATVIAAPLRAVSLSGREYQWYDTNAIPDVAIDLLVVDGPPVATGEQARYPAGPVLFPKLVSDARVFVDDAGRAQEQTIVQRWLQENPDFKVKNIPAEKGCSVLMKE